MTFNMKPLGCDPARIKGMSERLIVSHYENNYGGTVKRLNAIEEQFAELDFASAPAFVVNGLKREQLIAMNSMVLHELFFDGLGDASEPIGGLRDALARDFGSYERWRSEFLATGNVAVIENFAPPRICFLLTQAIVFMSMITALRPVPNTSPCGPFDSSRV